MDTYFEIAFKRSNGNLHLTLTGNFDGSSAWKLIHFLHEIYSGTGKIFVDTHDLRCILPFGCSVFKSYLNQRRLPADRLIFKGEKGVEMAPQGSRVLMASKHHRCRCSGACKSCPCRRGDKSGIDQPVLGRLQHEERNAK